MKKTDFIETPMGTDKIKKIAIENSVAVSFGGEYLDFNVINPCERISNVLDLLTYGVDENENNFKFLYSQAEEIISSSIVPNTLECEDDIVKVIEIIASKDLAL